MAQVGSNSAAAAAAAEPGAFKSAPSNLEMLRKHIQENFGPTLAPSLEVLLFRRGWLHCTVDEFYGNLQTHSSAIVAEFSRTLSEFQLLSGIEENLLKALYLTHGQSQAMFLVQAMRMFTVQERFEGLLHPAKLLKLVALVQPNQQRSQPIGMASQSPFGSATSSFNRVSSSPLTTPTHATLGAQPYRSNSSAPTPQRSNSSGFEDAHPGFGPGGFAQQPGHPAAAQTPQQIQGRPPLNSWNVQTPHNQLYQPSQLSPYPTSRPQHLHHGHAASQDAHRFHDPLPFTLGTGISQQSADALMAGTILPQEEPSPRRGVPPPAPTALCVDDYDLTGPGHQPPPTLVPVGFTPTKGGAPTPSNAMSWADATEEDELARQRAARESARQEAELKAFLAQHDQSRLMEALRGYTLERLAALSPKQFEAELKMRVCSKAARQHLMELLHPDGVFPTEPAVAPSSAGQPGGGSLKPQGGPTKGAVAPDLASTKALLTTLNVRTPEKEKRPVPGDEKGGRPAPSDGRRGRYGDDDEPSSRPGAERFERSRDRDREHRDRGKGRDDRHGSRYDTRYQEDQEEEDDRYGRGGRADRGDSRDHKQQSDRDRERQDAGRRRRTAYDDEYEEEERYYGRERDGSKVSREPRAEAPYPKETAARKTEAPAPRRATTQPVEVPAPRHGRRDTQADREPVPLGPLRQRSVVVTLNGVRSITMDDLHHAMARLGTVVDEAFIGDDGAEFELSHHIDALPSMETVQVRTTNGTQRVVIESVHFKKANSGGSAQMGRDRREKEQNFNQPCRYFLSKDGCNRGESCKYQHMEPAGEEGRRGTNSRERSARNARGRRDYGSDEKGTSDHADRQTAQRTDMEGTAP